ncbi:hypothetical protein AI27_03400 [Sphingomonas sp. BHC-A]|uniref:Uncharacterized protein n=1 Tax=Sphingobium indicum (strain DSM 16412 / CCM 7286 / MTCC 6364 / B90A) TaxID=861109 RepID=A0A1L5BPR9_SPHIB|nr:hypothetical protein SIDU_10250 [Sphingobium indicum B90A]KEZ00471.1 hypothetical protein AI27_03400 [Sphingomonas sp. BHC-A]
MVGERGQSAFSQMSAHPGMLVALFEGALKTLACVGAMQMRDQQFPNGGDLCARCASIEI